LKLLKAECLKVPKKLGEQALQIVTKIDLLNRKLRIHQIDDFICIPLKAKPSPIVLKEFNKKFPNFKTMKFVFTEKEKRHLTLIDFLTDKIPGHLLSFIPHAIDFIGTIAIVEVPKELENYKALIGSAILKTNKHTTTVLAKTGAVKGIYRIRKLQLIAGIKKTTTIYKEYGHAYHVDVAKAYFSPRLSTERNRVALLVKEGETVVDLFSGVGPFAVPIGKMHKNVLVYAIDVNPDAVNLLKRNIAINRVEKQIVPILGDSRQIVQKQLLGKANRIIMNLPETAINFVDVACEALKLEGGIIHYYCFTKHYNPLETAKFQLMKAVKQNNRKKIDFVFAKKIREVAPYTWQVVLDAKIH
jgi:tRNA (guanine37-N1)-methyltransferase